MNSWPLHQISTTEDAHGRLHTTVRAVNETDAASPTPNPTAPAPPARAEAAVTSEQLKAWAARMEQKATDLAKSYDYEDNSDRAKSAAYDHYTTAAHYRAVVAVVEETDKAREVAFWTLGGENRDPGDPEIDRLRRWCYAAPLDELVAALRRSRDLWQDLAATAARARDEAQAAVVGAQRERDEARGVSEADHGKNYRLGASWSTDLLIDWLCEAATHGHHSPDNLRVCAQRLAELYYGLTPNVIPTPEQVERAARVFGKEWFGAEEMRAFDNGSMGDLRNAMRAALTAALTAPADHAGRRGSDADEQQGERT